MNKEVAYKKTLICATKIFVIDLGRNIYVLLYIHVNVRRHRFLFNNQTDALFIQIYSVIKIYMFPYCTFGIAKFHAGYDDRFQAESG